jgi:hypothetical protein
MSISRLLNKTQHHLNLDPSVPRRITMITPGYKIYSLYAFGLLNKTPAPL